MESILLICYRIVHMHNISICMNISRKLCFQAQHHIVSPFYINKKKKMIRRRCNSLHYQFDQFFNNRNNDYLPSDVKCSTDGRERKRRVTTIRQCAFSRYPTGIWVASCSRANSGGTRRRRWSYVGRCRRRLRILLSSLSLLLRGEFKEIF